MKLFWLIWLGVMLLDHLLPFFLAPFFKGYRHKTMLLSILGCTNSPVKWMYNIWCVFSGVAFVFGGAAVYGVYQSELSVAACVLLALYGIGCEILSGLFPIKTDGKEKNLAYKIHGGGSALGFTALLFVPLMLSLEAFVRGEAAMGAVVALSFLLAAAFFACFIMGEKEGFCKTALRFTGLWQRLVLVFCYLPLGVVALQGVCQ